MAEKTPDEAQNDVVTGESIKPDESRTPAEFAREELLTPEQIALQMGVTAARVREWIDSGLLTPVREGSVERVRRSELHRVGNPDESASQAFEAEHQA